MQKHNTYIPSRLIVVVLAALLQLLNSVAPAQQFTAGRLVVERVGTGVAQSSAGTPVFLDEYTITGASGISLPLPTVNASPVNRTVESGTATSDGMITRTTDGKYLAVPGYDAAVGTAAIVSSALNKVVTRVDGNGNFASTVVSNATAFPGNNYRSVVTADGSGYWLSGAGTGPVYVAHTGSTTAVAGTQVSSTSTNNRNILIFGGQLYASTGTGSNTGVYSVGTGLPTGTGNTMTVNANLGSSGDPYSFVILDYGGTSVMYITDFTAKLLYKYYRSAGIWIASGSAAITVAGTPTGFYAITGNVAGGIVYLYATTTSGSGSASRIVSFTDPTVPTAALSGSIASTTIVGPTTNTAFHGITFTPFTVTGIAATSPSVCTGSGTTITISGNPNTSVTYQLNGITQPDVTISGGGTYSFSTGPLTAGATYSVISATDGITTQPLALSVTVSVNPLPTVSAGPGMAICAGSSATLMATGAVTYTWTPATGLSATTGGTISASPITTTVYSVTGTDANGCMNTATTAVTVNALPAVSAGSNVAICSGSSAPLTASGAVTYTWAPAAGLSATTGSTVIATPVATTIYTVTGNDGCVNTAMVTVSVNPLPTVSTGPGMAICAGTSATLAATGAVTYTWTPSAGLSATTGGTISASPITTTTYTVTGTDANGCMNTASIAVTVNALPAVSAGPNIAICSGSATALTATGGVTYSWAPATGLSATTGSAVTASPGTTTTYTVTGSNGLGCSNTAMVTVTVNPLPIVSAGPGVSVCIGSFVALTATGAATYTWSPASGLSSTVGSTVTASPTVTVAYIVTGTDTNGCSSSASVIVTVNPSPTISAGPDVVICSGSSATLTVSGASSYTWFPATGLSVTTGSTVIASPTVTTTYEITGTNSLGCTNITSVTVSVNPVPSLVAGPGSVVCAGSAAVLTVSGATTYTWSPGAGLSATTGSSVTATPLATVTYTITGSDGLGCNSVATITVTVNPLPVISGGSGVGICIGSSATLTATGAATYTWLPATGLSSTVGSSVTASPTVTTIYTITGTDANGCVNRSSVNVIVNPLPVVTTGPGGAICSGAPIVLTAGGATSYVWSPGTGLSVSTGGIVIASPTVTTTYTITGTSAGCVGTATVTVTVNTVPDTFTVTGGGSFCGGGTGVPVGLSGSQPGFHYRLYCSSVPVGTFVSGTGSAFSFGPQVISGLYTVVATDPATGCTRNMAGSALLTITAGPAIVTVTGGGPFCTGGPGSHVGLTGSAIGVDYQLYRDTVAVGAPVPGPGFALDFGPQSVPGIYKVIGTFAGTSCSSNMAGTATVSINSLPSVFNVTGGGDYCKYGTGVHIGLDGSQIGVHYQAWMAGTPMGGSVIGLATPLDLGLFTTAGTYSVTGTFSATGCVSNMAGSALVVIDSLPVISGPRYVVSPGNTTILTGTPAGGTWTSHDPAFVAIDSSSGVVTGVALGTVDVTYTLPTGCFTTHSISVTPYGGLSAPGLNAVTGASFILAPNPNNGVFTLSGTFADNTHKDVQVQITDMVGKVVYAKGTTATNGKMNEPVALPGIAAGIYFLSLRTATENIVLRFTIDR